MKISASCWFAPVAFAFDRITKAWARSTVQPHPLDIWPGVFRLVYAENTGAAFGILQGKQTFLLIATGPALLGLLIWLILKGNTISRYAQAALWLLLGGALGNFYDRLFYGYVVDFMEIRLFTFPVFNIADCCVCLSFFLLAWWAFFYKEKDANAV